jgi:LPXTG-site transpeptidase (sortase) family protein
MSVLKFAQKLTAVLLLLSVLAGATFFIIYPNLSDIKIAIRSYKAERIARNTTLQLLTRLSPPNLAAVEEDVRSSKSLEHVSTEELIKLKNEGKILFNMEKSNTVLQIDSADIKGKVVDDETALGMDRGFWHFPLSSQPGKRGNTVIIAHRFLYLPPRTDTFFSLDKVQIGDSITVTQDGGTYNYTVIERKIVEKTNRDVLTPTSDYRITLITCTPLWTSDRRLVVVGKLDKIYGNI